MTRAIVSAAIVLTLYASQGIHAGASPVESGWHETVLHNFHNGADSAHPSSSLISDAAGNLYGETQGDYSPCPQSHAALGGIGIRSVCGTVYELSPPTKSNAAWTETILYAFVGHDGTCCPHGGLTFDANGNLYGALSDGEFHPGAIFELSPTKSGVWQLALIYRFRDLSDGSAPRGSLIFDRRGNLFGVTTLGGLASGGTVFELSPPRMPGARWKHTVLLNFVTNGPNGNFPQGGLALDRAGNLYGTTEFGGTVTPFCLSGCGVVYQLVPPQSGGSWTQNVLLPFNGSTDGASPLDGLVWDAMGDLYGTTSTGEGGGPDPGGTVFRLAPNAGGGAWTETVLYGFPQFASDAEYPGAGVRIDAAGNLYGTTQEGGPQRLGTVFRLAPPAPGGTTWTESLLHTFGGNPNDGVYPGFAVLIAGQALYDTTTYGGGSANCPGVIGGCGLAFALSH